MGFFAFMLLAWAAPPHGGEAVHPQCGAIRSVEELKQRTHFLKGFTPILYI